MIKREEEKSRLCCKKIPPAMPVVVTVRQKRVKCLPTKYYYAEGKVSAGVFQRTLFSFSTTLVSPGMHPASVSQNSCWILIDQFFNAFFRDRPCQLLEFWQYVHRKASKSGVPHRSAVGFIRHIVAQDDLPAVTPPQELHQCFRSVRVVRQNFDQGIPSIETNVHALIQQSALADSVCIRSSSCGNRGIWKAMFISFLSLAKMVNAAQRPPPDSPMTKI